MDTDWMKEFDKINIPYADCFVHEHQVNKRVEKANKKFNRYYANCVQLKLSWHLLEKLKLFILNNQQMKVVLNPSTYS